MKKKRACYILIIWICIFFAYLEFGFECLNPFLLIHKLDRHLVILSAPLVLIVSYFIWDLKNGKYTKFISIFLICFLLFTSLYYAKNIAESFKVTTRDFDEIYNFLKENPEKNIYGDEGTVTQLNFRFQYKKLNLIKDLQLVKSCDEIKDSYVIVDGQRTWIDNMDLASRLPKCIFYPPENWIKLKEVPSLDRWGISSGRNPKIFYAE